MTYPKAFRLPGQHRRLNGFPAARCVAALWQREHPGKDPEPVENLGMGNYAPRHALNPVRQRVYLAEST